MLEVFIDYRNNKIQGYNTIILEERKTNIDCIMVEGENEKKILECFYNGNLFYIDGQVTEKEYVPDEKESQLAAVDMEIAEVQGLLQDGNEYKTFMDNILSGMTIQAAKKLINDNRGKLSGLLDRKRDLEISIAEDIETVKLQILEKEEENIPYKYFLSGLTVVRDENDYIEEWLRYHIEDCGFEHFYIYDNESVIPVRDYLESVNFAYMDKLTIFDWPTTESLQTDASRDFFDNYRMQTRWVLNFDPDEYVVISDESKSLVDFLKENHKYAAIQCRWRFFNANGQEYKEAGTDMERFTVEVEYDEWSFIGKVFAQTNRIRGYNIHHPQYREISRIIHYGEADDYFRLNHYYTRSYEEWVKKMERGSSVSDFGRKYSEFFLLNPDMEYLNTGEDFVQGYGPNVNVKEVMTDGKPI